MLIDLEEADMMAAGEKSARRGTLTVTAPVAAGEDIMRPCLGAYRDAFPAVSVRLHLLDGPANLIDEGIDVALRIAHLADSRLVAVGVGQVRRGLAASPRYLAQHPRIREPADLAQHQIVALTHFGLHSSSFPPSPGPVVARSGPFTPPVTLTHTPRAA